MVKAGHPWLFAMPDRRNEVRIMVKGGGNQLNRGGGGDIRVN